MKYTKDMNKKELLVTLKEVYNNGVYDEEAAHIQADYALIEFINDNEIREAYNKIGKWYA